MKILKFWFIWKFTFIDDVISWRVKKRWNPLKKLKAREPNKRFFLAILQNKVYNWLKVKTNTKADETFSFFYGKPIFGKTNQN